MGKTVIHSCSKLAYEMAQQMIEGTLVDDWSQFKSEHGYIGRGPYCNFTLKDITEVSLRCLQLIEPEVIN